MPTEWLAFLIPCQVLQKIYFGILQENLSTWAKKVHVGMRCKVFCYYCYHLHDRYCYHLLVESNYYFVKALDQCLVNNK